MCPSRAPTLGMGAIPSGVEQEGRAKAWFLCYACWEERFRGALQRSHPLLATLLGGAEKHNTYQCRWPSAYRKGGQPALRLRNLLLCHWLGSSSGNRKKPVCQQLPRPASGVLVRNLSIPAIPSFLLWNPMLPDETAPHGLGKGTGLVLTAH